MEQVEQLRGGVDVDPGAAFLPSSYCGFYLYLQTYRDSSQVLYRTRDFVQCQPGNGHT